jgi:hypothetical protein
MIRKAILLSALLAACGGVKHSVITHPTATDVGSEELARLGGITSLRENGGMLFVGAQRGVAAVDGAGKVLWTVALPDAMARLVEADADGVAWTSFNPDGVVEGSAVSHFLIGDLGDEPHYKDQAVGAATREGKLLFNTAAYVGITQMSPPGLNKDSLAVSRGRGFFVYSRADGHEIGKSPLLGDSSLADPLVLNGSFNRPAFFGGSWYVSHLGDFMKTDASGKEQDRTRIWNLFLALDNLTIGPMLVRDRLIVGSCPTASDKMPGLFAFDKEGGKDWKSIIDDKVGMSGKSGVGAIAANSKYIYAATNFRVVAVNDKGSMEWDQKNKGGLHFSKYRGLRFTRNYGARPAQGQLIVADEKNVYVATSMGKKEDALTVLKADSGDYVGSLALGTFVSDMAIVGDRLALSTDDGLKFIPLM